MTLGPFGTQAWADLGGDPADAHLVDDAVPPLALGARLAVDRLLADSAAVATLAIQRAQSARGAADAPVHRVRVAGDRVATAAQSERHLQIDGVAPAVWAPLSGFWPAADGWVRTHGNYPHHAARLARLLGIEVDAHRDRIATAIAAWPAVALEDAAADAGAIAGAVRTRAQWAAHPHGAQLAAQPLIGVRRRAGASARRWQVGGSAPLAGCRILDLTRVIAGPTGTRDLALAGADVLRVDSPRLPEPAWQHLDTGAGKRSTLLDLDAAADRRTFDELLTTADAVVTGYRPGALDRFGLSPDALLERADGIVVCTVSAWGRSGPWAHRRGFDSIVQAVSGIALAESTDGSTPGAMPAQALDHSAGHFLAGAVAQALVRQRQEGGSWALELSLARIAHALLAAGPVATVVPAAVPPPTLQQRPTARGSILWPAPALVFPGAPDTYSSPATPWGSDAPRWPRR